MALSGLTGTLVFWLTLFARVECWAGGGDLRRLVVRETVGNHFSEVIVDALHRYYVQNHSSTQITRLATMSRQTYDLQSDIMDEVMQRTSHRIAYVFGAGNQRSRRPRIFNIAFVDGYGAFLQLFSALDPAYNDFSGYYLIVLTAIGQLLPETLQRIFAFLWSLNVVNVNVVTADLEDHSRWQSVLMYTYYPYREGACEQILPRLLHRFRKGQRMDKAVQMFPEKLDNFHECCITVATFHLPPYVLLRHQDTLEWNSSTHDAHGVEGDLLWELAKRLNFTVRLTVPDDRELWGAEGEPDPDGSYSSATGSVRLVVSGRANLTLGRFAIHGGLNRAMKHSRSYYTVPMVFALPPGRPYTPFEKLFRPFARSTWLALVAFLAVGVATIAVIRFTRAPECVSALVYGRGIHLPLLNLLIVFFGGAMPRLPRGNFARTLLLLWMGYCLVMRSGYQGSLFEYLQEKKNFSHPSTVRGLLAEPYNVHSMRGTAKSLELIPGVAERAVWLPDDDAYVERYLQDLAGFRVRGALFTDYERVAYYNRHHYRTGYVHIVGEVLVHLPIGFYYPKQSCLVNAFDREIDGLLMSGFFPHRLQRYINYDFFRHQPHHHVPSPLTNDQLTGSYEALAVLLLVALVVHLLELASVRLTRLRRALAFLHSE
uniref:Putative ionotropic receptor ligand binding domain-containing protein n=1 Tax=Anopheles atroparvus TaxID=41427 RepID=A0A182JIF6_ANOAO